MNLFFRLIHLLLFSRFRSTIGVFDSCPTPFRVWPTDLDVLRHMNNGVYFSLQDLARMDYMIRAKASVPIQKRGWYPVVASEMIRFRKSLQCFQKFEIRTQLISWDEKYLYLEQKFVSQDDVVAIGMIRARFLKKSGGSVSPQELLQALGLEVQTPSFPSYLKSWIQAESDLASSVLGPKT